MNKYKTQIAELLEIKDELYSKNLITPFGGNISVRCPDNPENVLITPGGVYKASLQPEQILCVDLEGKIINETEYKSTSETPIHLAILRRRTDINAIIHTHATYANLLGLTGIDILPINGDAVIAGNLPIVEWTVTGSKESGEIVSEAFSENGYAVLIRNHGLFVGGPTLKFASGITRMIEDTCEKLVKCKMMGIAPRELSKENIAVVQEALKKGFS